MGTLQRKLVGLLHENDGLRTALTTSSALIRRQQTVGGFADVARVELEAALRAADAALEAAEQQLCSIDHGNLQVGHYVYSLPTKRA